MARKKTVSSEVEMEMEEIVPEKEIKENGTNQGTTESKRLFLEDILGFDWPKDDRGNLILNPATVSGNLELIMKKFPSTKINLADNLSVPLLITGRLFQNAFKEGVSIYVSKKRNYSFRPLHELLGRDWPRESDGRFVLDYNTISSHSNLLTENLKRFSKIDKELKVSAKIPQKVLAAVAETAADLNITIQVVYMNEPLYELVWVGGAPAQ